MTRTSAHVIGSPAAPLVEELHPAPEVAAALQAVAHLPGVVLLESCLQRKGVGRYSFLTADPVEIVQRQTISYGTDPFSRLRNITAGFPAHHLDGLPPFQGGIVGILSYELGQAWEKWSSPRFNEFQLPLLWAGVYDWVLVWDHQQQRAWLLAHGWGETEDSRRTDRAARRLKQVRAWLAGKETAPTNEGNSAAGAASEKRLEWQDIPPNKRAPQFPVFDGAELTSDFSRESYLRAVERVLDSITAGEIFQANLSQRLLSPRRFSPLELYCRLRERNPAPFAGYVAADDWAVVSASPERFLRVRGDEVETRPIKGTRKRQPAPEADLFTRDELRESTKDQAENVMIVDLLRNDLSRVCQPGTIRVPRLCAIETYETVQHLVSEVRGRLEPQHTVWDLFAATFPGGSITGAPKVRAMEIIAEREPTVRGPYCGSLFYAGFNGEADSSILIRTFICRHGSIQCPVGGGIVARSHPTAEYEETLHKAEGMLRALY